MAVNAQIITFIIISVRVTGGILFMKFGADAIYQFCLKHLICKITKKAHKHGVRIC